MDMAITIHDVARRAQVSHTTVSWAIHDDPRITAETKARVAKAIEELGYRPNLSARSLVSGRTHIVAVVAASYTTLFELEVMQGIEEALDRSSKADTYAINQYATGAETTRKETILTTLLRGRRADAVIALSLKPSAETIAAYAKEGVPLVLIEEDDPQAIVVKTDNVRGARIATEHLLSRGRRRIALALGSVEGEESGLSPRERLEGFKQALEGAGVAYDPRSFIEVDGYRHEDGKLAFERLMEAYPEADSVFCGAGDLIATGLIRGAQARGKRVPEDFAVVGYDDSFIAPLFTPSLTTVRQPLVTMGAEALDLAFAAMDSRKVVRGKRGAAAQQPEPSPAAEEPAAPERRIFPPELVLRLSS